jgi:hypothetical protein
MSVNRVKALDHSSIEVGNDVQLGGVVRALLSIMDMYRIGLLDLANRQMGDVELRLPYRSVELIHSGISCLFVRFRLNAVEINKLGFSKHISLSYRFPRECLSLGRSSRC